ncbi:hypothetical protein [Cytobacillus sp. IB215316]|uniref:hypothetical protein n=1 Tax=Cytobacillus sp. IB215316 TaxID=3097354 RepID=UPI002A1510C4|nr:hypothetical protein [Cytobacillus sp. IB215316]MDX8362971.1 hypothetical protein [Cytobacillus sp. IB215316]
MSQYKKVSTCCKTSISKEDKCDCPCQLIVDNISMPYGPLPTGTTAEIYNGRPLGLHGDVSLSDPTTGVNDRVVFTTNGIFQPINLDATNFNKLFSFENVTKIEVTCIEQTEASTCRGVVEVDGMTVPCKPH